MQVLGVLKNMAKSWKEQRMITLKKREQGKLYTLQQAYMGTLEVVNFFSTENSLYNVVRYFLMLPTYQLLQKLFYHKWSGHVCTEIAGRKVTRSWSYFAPMTTVELTITTSSI